MPPGAPGLAATLDFTTPDERSCRAKGLLPLRGAAAQQLVVRYRGVGNNAVKNAFKAAGFRRDPPSSGGQPAVSLPPSPADFDGTSPWTALWGGQLTVDEYTCVAAGQKARRRRMAGGRPRFLIV